MHQENKQTTAGTSFSRALDPRSQAELSYRRDIDGLRAIAVLLVVFAHLNIATTGGFIGVDLFFVISGYLISATITREMRQGAFSLTNFYERRVRRIFPAMLGCFIATTLMAYQYLLPSETIAYGKSLLAALFSSSNILFWKESGYFVSNFKPLLHTWSLGVEEQFYAVFPLFLLLAFRLGPRRMRGALYLAAAASFVLAEILVKRHPMASFFLSPLRAWELLTGAILSQKSYPALQTRYARNIASAAGLLLIALPAFEYTPTTQFPGISALPPCLGAALIIAAGETGPSIVGDILSLPPFTFLGLISYSLYLWHWPLKVFQELDNVLVHASFAEAKTKLAILGVSIIAATMSWALVERPFRFGKARPKRGDLFAINGAGVAGLTAAAFIFIWSGGFPNRLPPEAKRMSALLNYDPAAFYREGACFVITQRQERFHPEVCLAQHPGRPSLLIYGDSHAADLWWGLTTVFRDRDILEAASSTCPPYPPELLDGQTDECRSLSDYMFHRFFPLHAVDTVLLSARWRPDDTSALRQTLNWFRARQIHVVLSGPAIEYTVPLANAATLALRDAKPLTSLTEWSQAQLDLDKRMNELADTEWHIPYISQYKELCRPQCPVLAAPDKPTLFDTDHFTMEGSILFARAVFDDAQKPLAIPNSAHERSTTRPSEASLVQR